MVIGMATRKVTITLDQEQLDRIRARVDAGTAPSVSGCVKHAAAVALDDVAGWGALLPKRCETPEEHSPKTNAPGLTRCLASPSSTAGQPRDARGHLRRGRADSPPPSRSPRGSALGPRSRHRRPRHDSSDRAGTGCAAARPAGPPR